MDPSVRRALAILADCAKLHRLEARDAALQNPPMGKEELAELVNHHKKAVRSLGRRYRRITERYSAGGVAVKR